MGVTDTEEKEAYKGVKGVHVNINRGGNKNTEGYSDVNGGRGSLCHKDRYEGYEAEYSGGIRSDGLSCVGFET